MVAHGRCTPGFEAVRDAFVANFTERGEVGAGVAVIIDGDTVVDLWGGLRDPIAGARWMADTVVNAYSVGKAFLAALVLREVDRGVIALDEPVSTYWPEFAAAGKRLVTVRHALTHRAGVPAIREPLSNDDLWDFDRMCDALAATEPWWPAGERHAYHTNTYGHLLGGLLRRATGHDPGTLLRDVASRVDADVWWGLADSELERCATVVWDGPSPPNLDASALDALDVPSSMVVLGYANPPGYSSTGVVNSEAWRRAQIPSTNGHMTALGIARFYGGLLDGVVVSPDLLAEATRAQSSGPCPVLGQDVTFGLGFQPWTEHRPFGRTPGSFGHYGTGGSLGFADPTRGIAFGYVMNHVIPRWQSPRNRALVDAVYASLGS